ncbi:MAG TPA: hypothetical protein VGM60_19835 [Pseudonocardia sp.]|uniref:hypothetical protein n=1 Tax=Pseudonocardia sp. TaxID=60912 RepID=UPI002F3E4014
MRSIRWSELFRLQCARLALDDRVLDEILWGIEWAVVRDVTRYPAVPCTPYRVVHTNEYPGKPELIMFYEILTEELVEFVWIEENTEDRDDPLKW